ncbi:hypothetical protein CYJ37_07760 [Bacillus sp. UMB0728]|nr:hypothetical protein CYJ37_07760 [Bacillus sp. UMB0728]
MEVFEMMKSIFAAAAVLLAALLGGCAQDDNVAGIHEQNEDQNGTNLITDGGGQVKRGLDQVSDEDRDRTMSDQNPNFLNIDGGRVNDQSDVDKARQVVNQYTEYEPDEVWINGGRMWVTAHTDKSLSAEEKRKAQAELHKTLTKALPRYNIEVRLSER